LRWLADRLADDRHRLDELRVEGLEVRASLALSYRALSPKAQRLFGLLGMIEEPETPAWQAAALLGDDLATAEASLDELVEAHLLDVADPGDDSRLHYRLHDLVRAYAREHAGDPEDRTRLALLRMLNWWPTHFRLERVTAAHPSMLAT
jgi:hypothetical protein